MSFSSFEQDEHAIRLFSPLVMPKASGFLWNRKMMLQMNCRGYAISQFMQPEPAKYSCSPALEAKTFMQPEQQFYRDHPGRFFYIRDEDKGECYSLPYEPMRVPLDSFEFAVTKDAIQWTIEQDGLRLTIFLSLVESEALEVWRFSVENTTGNHRKIQVFPTFSIGYMSWMNQSARFNADLSAVIAHKITPYQLTEDYQKQKNFNEYTFLACDNKPVSYCCSLSAFEGEGGLHDPGALECDFLPRTEALYETPIAAMQFEMSLAPKETQQLNLIFGVAKDEGEIAGLTDKYLKDSSGLTKALAHYRDYIDSGKPHVQINCPDEPLNLLVNQWLPRQIFYHGSTNRLTTDPQTRNLLQDSMGMSYIQPETSRNSLSLAISQQLVSGEMPDGILLDSSAELKYINQIPHADHCVWLPICLKAYLDETADFTFLQQSLSFKDSEQQQTVYQHLQLAMHWLYSNLDHRKLSFIAQGDWCDPMNMVGVNGVGVSGWLTLATAYAYSQWAKICHNIDQIEDADFWLAKSKELNSAVNQHLWNGQWFARGITDDGRVFGTQQDTEGRIYLNAQSWALLSGAADLQQRSVIIEQVERQLSSPHGFMMLAPAYTKMQEDIGRLTQKFPGTAENGSVYNHAAAFYIYSLYEVGESDKGFHALNQMLVTEENALVRGQIPAFIPNYYRGAYYQFPDVAGRSSQLFNTGTIAWIYRTVIEQLFGLKGSDKGLTFAPQLPSHWQNASITRHYLGAQFNVCYTKDDRVSEMLISVDGRSLERAVMQHIVSGAVYDVDIRLPC